MWIDLKVKFSHREVVRWFIAMFIMTCVAILILWICIHLRMNAVERIAEEQQLSWSPQAPSE